MPNPELESELNLFARVVDRALDDPPSFDMVIRADPLDENQSWNRLPELSFKLGERLASKNDLQAEGSDASLFMSIATDMLATSAAALSGNDKSSVGGALVTRRLRDSMLAESVDLDQFDDVIIGSFQSWCYSVRLIAYSTPCEPIHFVEAAESTTRIAAYVLRLGVEIGRIPVPTDSDSVRSR